MLKKIFSKFFNSSSNTGVFPTKTVKNNSDEQNLSPEKTLSKWLAHPNEYGKKPIYSKIIETGVFKFNFIPGDSKMKYSLIEYQMSKDEKIEIGIVDEMSAWSFLNILDYQNADLHKLKLAYFGKLSQLMDIRLNVALKKTSSNDEQKRIENLFIKKTGASKDAFQILDTYKFINDTTFFLSVLNPGTEGQPKLYLPGLANANEIDIEETFEDNDPISQIGMYYEMGKVLTKI